MKVMIEDGSKKITLEGDLETCYEVLAEMIVPSLHAIGFGESTIKDAIIYLAQEYEDDNI